jgi:hypothetical protein
MHTDQKSLPAAARRICVHRCPSVVKELNEKYKNTKKKLKKERQESEKQLIELKSQI